MPLESAASHISAGLGFVSFVVLVHLGSCNMGGDIEAGTWKHRVSTDWIRVKVIVDIYWTLKSNSSDFTHLSCCIPVSFLFFLKINLLQWHWFIKLHGLQAYTSMIHNLFVILRAHHPKSNHFPSPWSWPPYPLLLPPLPSGHRHTVVCVYGPLSVGLACSVVASSFTPHIWVESYDSWLFLSQLFYLAYSQDPSMLSQMAVFHLFLWLSGVPLCTRPPSSLSNHLSKGTVVASTCWPLWIMP